MLVNAHQVPVFGSGSSLLCIQADSKTTVVDGSPCTTYAKEKEKTIALDRNAQNAHLALKVSLFLL